MIIAHLGCTPVIDPDAWVAPDATVCGDVTISAGARIMHGARVIAEGGAIAIGRSTIVMENAVVRSTTDHDCFIADHVLVGPKLVFGLRNRMSPAIRGGLSMHPEPSPQRPEAVRGCGGPGDHQQGPEVGPWCGEPHRRRVAQTCGVDEGTGCCRQDQNPEQLRRDCADTIRDDVLQHEQDRRENDEEDEDAQCGHIEHSCHPDQSDDPERDRMSAP